MGRRSNPRLWSICDWLEDVHPSPALWPADCAARAAARGLLRLVDDELTTNFFLSLRKEAFGLERGDHEEVVAVLRERPLRRWASVEGLLARAEGPWRAGGDSPSLADLAAIPLAVRLPAWKPELSPAPDEYPLASAWLETLRDRPSAAEVDRRGEPVAAG